jgi:hypothetical protein
MAGGAKLFSIPNAKALYSGESIYADKPSYNKHSDRPHSDRLQSLGAGIAAGIKEKVVSSIPDLPQGFLGAALNPIKEGYIERYNRDKHVNFNQAGKVDIPGINSLYSVYAMSWGLTNPDITAVLTKEDDDGKETLIAFEYKGMPVSPDKLSEKMLNTEAVTAGVLSELTNKEIEKSDMKDVNPVLKAYLGSEYFVYGAKGKRSAVKKDADGKMIFRYERPSRGEFFKYYLMNDATYTLLDWGLGAGTGLAGLERQKFNEGEIREVIKYTQQDYGTKNIGGAPNPFAAGYRKAA